jgi:predicted NACHT family NTPase
MNYLWKRFWCPRDGSFSLSDRGYLYDPDSEYGDRVNPQLAHLVSFEDTPCLVLLGEPGIGKSTEFNAEHARVSSAAAEVGDACCAIDLKDYQTDVRLVSEAFENDIVHAWLEGSHVLHLFLDSLDEGRLEVRNIASVLSGRLRRLDPHLSRLRLRIACRTAEWPVSLEQSLKELWNREENVGVIELAPLRRIDVIAAAQSEHVNADRFLDDLARVDAQPFAINPISLRFLLSIYRRSGELPHTKHELYESG